MVKVKFLFAAGAAASALAAGAYGLSVASAPVQTAAAASSDAAAARHWQIKYVGNYKSQSAYGSVLALGSRDVWAGGNTGMFCCGGALAAHWNGKSWSSPPLPSGFVTSARGYSGSVWSLSGSASGNVWAIANSAVNDYTYTLRWDGRRWSVEHNWKYARLGSLTVLGPNNVWATDSTDSTLGAWHYDGKSWKLISAPLTFQQLSAVSANDIWAAGAALDKNNFWQPRVAHWNGHSWRIVASPAVVSASQGTNPAFSGISAASDHDVWTVGYTGAADGSFLPVALHWNGTRWQRMDPAGVRALGSVSPDGRGGAWAAEGTGYGLGRLLHFSSGRWSQVALPGQKGRVSQIDALALVPHSATVWAAGRLAGPFPKAGPVPRQAEVLTY